MVEMKLELIGDLCPANQRLIPSFRSRRMISGARYRTAKEMLSYQAKIQARKQKIFFAEGEIEVEIETFYPRAHDVDSFIKIILDSLNLIAFTDDKQIRRLIVTKHKQAEKRAVILIRPYSQA